MATRQDHEHEHESPVAVSDGGMELMDEDGPIWVNAFTEDAARAFTKQLQYQSRQDPSAPLMIYIDSPGGEAYGLMTMLSALESVPNQIITVALGKAMSAGAILLACGDLRYASPHTTIMVHEVSAGTMGHIDDIKVENDLYVALNERLMKLLVKKCKIKGGLSSLRKTLAKARNLYMTAEEAKKFGIVDSIGVPMLHKSLNVQYVLQSNPRGENVASSKETKD